MHRNQQRESRKMKKQRKMFQRKKGDKASEKDLNEMIYLRIQNNDDKHAC